MVLHSSAPQLVCPFKTDISTTISGNIYYRILNISEQTTNLQHILSTSFDISDFQPNETIVVTYFEVPKRAEIDEIRAFIVSYQY